MIALAAAALSMSDQPRFLEAGDAPARSRAGPPDPARRRPCQPQSRRHPRSPRSTSCRSARPSPRAAAQPSRILLSAIDRMMPMLRFFRQGDGSFAHFNGLRRHRRPTSSPPCSPMTTSAARRSPTRRTAATSASRPAARSCSSTPAGRRRSTSRVNAHAGCLSFEMSVGRQRLIVNCGVPRQRRRSAPPPRPHHRRAFDRDAQRHLVLPLPDPLLGRRLARRGDRRPARPASTSSARREAGATVLHHAPQRLCRPLRHRP